MRAAVKRVQGGGMSTRMSAQWWWVSLARTRDLWSLCNHPNLFGANGRCTWLSDLVFPLYCSFDTCLFVIHLILIFPCHSIPIVISFCRQILNSTNCICQTKFLLAEIFTFAGNSHCDFLANINSPNLIRHSSVIARKIYIVS